MTGKSTRITEVPSIRIILLFCGFGISFETSLQKKKEVACFNSPLVRKQHTQEKQFFLLGVRTPEAPVLLESHARELNSQGDYDGRTDLDLFVSDLSVKKEQPALILCFQQEQREAESPTTVLHLLQSTCVYLDT